jgi:hypothetical protein
MDLSSPLILKRVCESLFSPRRYHATEQHFEPNKTARWVLDMNKRTVINEMSVHCVPKWFGERMCVRNISNQLLTTSRPDCVEVLWNNLYTKLYNQKEMLGAAAPWGTGVQLKEGVSADELTEVITMFEACRIAETTDKHKRSVLAMLKQYVVVKEGSYICII